VKEEEDMVDSSDIFAHISGVNSFKCNYPIQSWIWLDRFCSIKHYYNFAGPSFSL